MLVVNSNMERSSPIHCISIPLLFHVVPSNRLIHFQFVPCTTTNCWASSMLHRVDPQATHTTVYCAIQVASSQIDHTAIRQMPTFSFASEPGEKVLMFIYNASCFGLNLHLQIYFELNCSSGGLSASKEVDEYLLTLEKK